MIGNCPVQAEGTIDGKRFYFRARGERWQLEVHPTADGEYMEWSNPDDAWYYEEPWGDGPFAAGWMEHDEARRLIERGAEIYRKEMEASREG